MSEAVSFWIPGRPKSTQTGSVITAGGRSFPVRRNTPWSAVCGLVARAHGPAAGPFVGPVKVRLCFYMPKPKRIKGPAYPVTRPDLDGLFKGLCDSWQGILYVDDSQIVRLETEKQYQDDGRGPGVMVFVETL